MLDHQQIVDRIRAFIAGADQTRTDAIADLAAGYSSACREANDRLRRCGDYLRQGLRSEAIHAADCHPSLLDVVATLDMPEIDDWEQVCASYDLDRPSRMMIEVASELNEAYAEELQLRDLLVKHRTLALGRSPVQARLAVARELTIADPATPFWGEDQAALERAWLPAFRRQVTDAISAGDFDAINRLLADADPGVWRATVPADLLAALTKAAEAGRSAAGNGELEALAPVVREALRTGSYAELKKRIAKWDKVVARDKPDVPEELSDEILAARQWVAEYEANVVAIGEQEAACAALRQVLETAAPAEVIKSFYTAITSIGLGVPDDVEQDYRRVMGRLKAAKDLEKLLVVLGVAAGVLVVLAVVVAIVWPTIRR